MWKVTIGTWNCSYVLVWIATSNPLAPASGRLSNKSSTSDGDLAEMRRVFIAFKATCLNSDFGEERYFRIMIIDEIASSDVALEPSTFAIAPYSRLKSSDSLACRSCSTRRSNSSILSLRSVSTRAFSCPSLP
jgi:hypothetical protein